MGTFFANCDPAARNESTHQKTFSLRTDAPHPLHSRSALGWGHTECFHNCVRHLLDIVRIDQQRIRFELLGRAGELAQNECAILIGTARAIFLRYEIHSVLERRDERDVARAIVREKFFAIEPAKMILHRDPRARGETAVDVAHQPVNASFEFVISWNFYPAWHDDLDQHHAAAQLRISLERVAKCAKSFRNSLAVIQPVRTQHQLTIGKTGAQLLRPLRYRFGFCAVFERVEIDADREMPDANFSLFESDHMRLAARKNFRVRHDASHALQKVAHVAPGLEPEQIELKQRVQEPLLLRKLRKNIVRRKRDVQKKCQSPRDFAETLRSRNAWATYIR